MRGSVATVRLNPSPNPRHLLLGWAAARDAGAALEPFMLGGDSAFYGERQDSYLLMGAWPDEHLQLPAEDMAAFPWQPGAQRALGAIQTFIGDGGDRPADSLEEESCWRRPLTVGWLGHELTSTQLSRHSSFLVLHPATGQADMVAVCRDGSDGAAARLARERAAQVRLAEAAGAAMKVLPPVSCTVVAPVGRRSHGRRIQQVLAAIRAGDVYQVNLAHPLQLHGFPSGCVGRVAAFLDLWRDNPVPCPAFVQHGETSVLSLSPERYLARRRDLLESRPIKGTSPRGETAAADQAMARALAASAKDRAENIMIVDLVRNDLGKVAAIGSVAVPELRVIEEYATVFQMVSTVTATLRADRDALDLVRACFPGGSMTGAPKIEAMKIIDALEPTKRGVYSGAIGYFDYAGTMDLSIVIRTLVCRDGRCTIGSGGAVVADSDPAAEYQETLDKAAALIRAVGIVQREAEGDPA